MFIRLLTLSAVLALSLLGCQEITEPAPELDVTPLAALVPGAVYTVTNTADAGPGSLRQAILDANASSGLDAVHFAIGTGVQRIQPISPLPVITDPVTIDGTTQPGFSGTPIIELDGSLAGAADGLDVRAGISTIRGLVVNGFFGGGVRLGFADGSVIEGNYIGTDVTGTVARGNGYGVLLYQTAGNTVGGTTPGARNVISGNAFYGIGLNGNRNIIQGNYIGTDVTGSAPLGNGGIGVRLGGLENVIGGIAPGAGNVISGNGEDGIRLDGPVSERNVIQGNHVGVDATGTLAMGNGFGPLSPWSRHPGIAVHNATGTIIGGTEPGAGNVIAANKWDGILLGSAPQSIVQGNLIGTDVTGTVSMGNGYVGVFSAHGASIIGGADPGARNLISGNGIGIWLFTDSDGTVVRGNYIGTNVHGTASLGDQEHGILIDYSSDLEIGGTEPGAGNLISGNTGLGVWIRGSSGHFSRRNSVRGNLIGTDVTGIQPLQNGRYGVVLGAFASENLIGGPDDGGANTIAFNGSSAPGYESTGGIVLAIVSCERNAILSNSIFANGGLGIDLAGDGVTPNDAGDADEGSNNLQNFPTLTSVGSCGASTLIQGTLDSTPDETFQVELFVSATADPSGHGEGESFLGRVSVTTDGSGTGSFQLPLATGLPNGTMVTATATNEGGSTSEFSAAVAVVTLTPVQIIDALRDAVLDLAEEGAFESEEQANGLLNRLDRASASLANDRPNARMLLGGFIAEIEGLMTGGILTPEQGGPLVESAECAVGQLG